MRRTKIVATLGPATDQPGVLERLIEAGLDVGRFNLSHGSADDHRRRLEAFRQAALATGRHVAAMWDTKGPEVRLGDFPQPVEVSEGADFTLKAHSVPGTSTEASVSVAAFPSLVAVGEEILLDDGSVVLTVLSIDGGDVRCRVKEGGTLSSRKRVTAPGATAHLPAVSEEDIADLTLAASLGVEIVAASFVRTAAHVLELRELVERLSWHPVLIAKIETEEAVSNIDAIVRVADGIMVARGDLGLAVPTEEMPVVQKTLIASANRLGRPVVTATQMLESMVSHPRPTRAEATDVANAILDGTDAVMLSEETAAGSYPVEAVATMARIAEVADESLVASRRPPEPASWLSVTEAISTAIWKIASDLGARAIVSATQSGHTARMVARHRPAATIVATTPDPWTARKLALVWGVHPLVVPQQSSTDEVVDTALAASAKAGFAGDGDLVVVTAGVPVGISGTTNLIQVRSLGAPLVTGQGIGAGSARGPVRKVRDEADLGRVQRGDVLVVAGTTPAMGPALVRCVAIVAEEGGLTSPAAVAGVSLQKPVVVGAKGALGTLSDGEVVTVDARRGRVLRSAPGTAEAGAF